MPEVMSTTNTHQMSKFMGKHLPAPIISTVTKVIPNTINPNMNTNGFISPNVHYITIDTSITDITMNINTTYILRNPKGMGIIKHGNYKINNTIILKILGTKQVNNGMTNAIPNSIIQYLDPQTQKHAINL